VQRGEVERGGQGGDEKAVSAMFVPDVFGEVCGETLMEKRQRSIKTRFVICVDNRGFEASLERGKMYAVLPDREATLHRFLRVINESGEDYLFPRQMFRRNSSSKMPG
jgi:hypothetical protein